MSPAAGPAQPLPSSTPVPWVESQETRGGAPACLIGKSNGGYTFELVASGATPGNVVFSIQRADWALPAADAVPVAMTFADGMIMAETASMSSNGLSIPFDASSLHPWMHEFTKAANVLVKPSNNAFQPFFISLSGTTSAINRMGDCIKTSDMQDVPPPFVSASASTPAAAPSRLTTPEDTSLQAAITSCVPIADNLARLECYDHAAKAGSQPGAAQQASVSPTIPAQDTPAAAPPAQTGLTEDRFLAILDQASAAYDASSNDMAKGAARPARARALCAATTGTQISGWRGTVDTLSSNNAGKGVLTIRLSQHVTVSTTNNAVSDAMGMHTLLEPDSTVFKEAASLKEGQAVVFSGSFAQNDEDCLEEMSLTQEGSMHDPDFLFAFSSVKPAN